MVRAATPFVALAFLLAACGSTPSDRTLSGAGLAAAGGAVLGAVTGLGIAEGIVLGAAIGGLTGFLTDESKIDLGKPLWKSNSGFAPQPANAAPARQARVVSEIQAGLGALGYASGPVDGLMGPQTAEAIRQYQKRHDIPVDGRASRELGRHIQSQESVEDGG